MKKKAIKGLAEIYHKYNAFFIDLWGVVHNGVKLYPGAIEVLINLKKLNKKFVLLSNAPRPSKNVEKFLINLKMDKAIAKNVFTSGEAALRSLKKNIYGKNFYHLGPQRDTDLFKEFERNKKSLDDADFILCTGFLENKKDSLDYYKNLLKKHLNLKMICTNPDLVVHRGFRKEYCAGTLAAIFEELGGKVVYFGKPYPEIYNFCRKKNEIILAHPKISVSSIELNWPKDILKTGRIMIDDMNTGFDTYDSLYIKIDTEKGAYLERVKG